METLGTLWGQEHHGDSMGTRMEMETGTHHGDRDTVGAPWGQGQHGDKDGGDRDGDTTGTGIEGTGMERP